MFVSSSWCLAGTRIWQWHICRWNWSFGDLVSSFMPWIRSQETASLWLMRCFTVNMRNEDAAFVFSVEGSLFSSSSPSSSALSSLDKKHIIIICLACLDDVDGYWLKLVAEVSSSRRVKSPSSPSECNPYYLLVHSRETSIAIKIFNAI